MSRHPERAIPKDSDGGGGPANIPANCATHAFPFPAVHTFVFHNFHVETSLFAFGSTNALVCIRPSNAPPDP